MDFKLGKALKVIVTCLDVILSGNKRGWLVNYTGTGKIRFSVVSK